MKKYIITFVVLLTAVFSAFAQVRVACNGNSITYGSGIQDREHDIYPAQQAPNHHCSSCYRISDQMGNT